jgi:hypothetical protein
MGEPDYLTPGAKWRAQYHNWPHECCCAGVCQHRRRDGSGVMRCECPAACDYYCGPEASP